MVKTIKPIVKTVSFTFESPTATRVAVAGDFNGWDESRMPLRRSKDNSWRREIKLRPGRYEYKFFVDGSWILDPKNNNRICNSFGTENSVLEI